MINVDNIAFQTGDLITAYVNKMPFLFHKGLVVMDNGQPYIWHCSPTATNPEGGNVLYQPLAKYLSTRTFIGVKHHPELSRETIDQKAQSLLTKQFNYITYNCEHFTNQILSGKPYSDQVTLWTTGLITAGIILYLTRKQHKK